MDDGRERPAAQGIPRAGIEPSRRYVPDGAALGESAGEGQNDDAEIPGDHKRRNGPSHSSSGGEVEIIAGEFGGVKGPATTFTPVHLYNLRSKQGETVELSFPYGYTTAMLAIDGSALINRNEKLSVNNLALLERAGEGFAIEALEDGIFLVMSGEPIDEPIAQYGPFLMNTHAEIAQAIDDYQQGKFGYLE